MSREDRDAPFFVAIAPAFFRHPKVVALGGPRERWTWLGVLLYVAEYRWNGELPACIGDAVPGATEAFLRRCVTLELVDVDEDTGLRYVHDWDEYNGDHRSRLLAKERKRRQRARQRLGHADVTPQSRSNRVSGHASRARVPLPSNTSNTETANEETDLHPLLNAREEFSRLLALCGDVDADTAARITVLAEQAPADVIAGLLELGVHAADPATYVLATLQEATSGI